MSCKNIIQKCVLKTILAGAAFVVPSVMGTAYAGTISDTVVMAVKTHPTVAAGQAGVDIATQDIKENRSKFFPTLSIGGRAGRVHSNDDTTRANTADGGADQSWLGEGNVSLTQPLWDGLNSYHMYKAAQKRHDAAEADFQGTKEYIAIRAVSSHLNVMRTRELMMAATEFQNNVDDYQKRLKMLVDEGVVDEAELLQAQELVMRSQTMHLDYENLLRAAEADYREATGTKPEAVLSIGSITLTGLLPKGEDDAVAKGLSHHPDLTSAMERSKAISSDIKAERGTIMPKLDAELSYLDKDQDDNLGGEMENAQAMMRMTWDFSTGGAYFARVERSLKEKEEALAQELETRRRLERDIRRKYAALDTTSRQLDVFTKMETTNARVAQQFQSQYEGGKKTLLQLVNAQNKLFESKTARINSYYKRQLAIFELLSSMGQLRDVFGMKTHMASAK